MVRTQLYLDEGIHARLSALARRQGRTISELVREALVRAYGDAGVEERRRSLRAVAGLWKDREEADAGPGFVRRLRQDTARHRRLARRGRR